MTAMSALASALLLASSSLVIATSIGGNFGHKSTLSNTLMGYNQIAPASVCDVGPSYWCDPSTNGIAQCGLDWQTNIGVCGYSSGICPVTANATSFCTNYPNAFVFNGGLTNLVPGQYGYLVLAMYWAPSSCYSNGTESGGFCNAYTAKGTTGGTTMQLHGLWPDYGSLYKTPGTPSNIPVYPNFTNHYQGWIQYCAADPKYGPRAFNYSQCHVNGPLCPNKTVTKQSDYDNCMAANHVPGCIVDPTIISALKPQFASYAAGYLGSSGAFALHEFTKHGSCMGGFLTQSKQAYFQTAVSRAKRLRDSNSAIRLVQKRRGQSIDYATLRSALHLQGAAQCNSKCQLTEIWFCYAKDADGFPSPDLIKCGPGNLSADTCDPAIRGSKNCTTVIIPDFTLGPNIVP